MTNQEFLEKLQELLKSFSSGELEKKDEDSEFQKKAVTSPADEKTGEYKQQDSAYQKVDLKLFNELKSFVADLPKDYSQNAEVFSDELEFKLIKLILLSIAESKAKGLVGASENVFALSALELVLLRESEFCFIINSVLKKAGDEFLKIVLLLNSVNLFTLENFKKLFQFLNHYNKSDLRNEIHPLSNVLEMSKKYEIPFGQKQLDVVLKNAGSLSPIAFCLMMIDLTSHFHNRELALRESSLSLDDRYKYQKQAVDLTKLAKANAKLLFDFCENGEQIQRVMHNFLCKHEKLHRSKYVFSLADSFLNGVFFGIDVDEYKKNISNVYSDFVEYDSGYDEVYTSEKKKTNQDNMSKLIEIQEELQKVIHEKFYHLSSDPSPVARAMAEDKKFSQSIPAEHPLISLIMSFVFFKPAKEIVTDIPDQNIVTQHFSNKEEKEYKASVEKYMKMEFGSECLHFVNEVLRLLKIESVIIVETGVVNHRSDLLQKLQAEWPENPKTRYVAAIIATLPNEDGVPQHATLVLFDKLRLRIECIDSYGVGDNSGLPMVKAMLERLQETRRSIRDQMSAEISEENVESSLKLYDELLAYKIIVPPADSKIQQKDQFSCISNTWANLLGMVIEKENIVHESKNETEIDKKVSEFFKRSRIDVESGKGISERTPEELFDFFGIMKLARDLVFKKESQCKNKQQESKGDAKPSV